MIRFLTLLFWGIALVCIAQKSPIKYGEIPMEDMQMTIYPGDSSASAVVLADYGNSYMDYTDQKGFSLVFERITRIKILKTEGLDWGNFSIPLYHRDGNSEKLQNLKAATHNLDDNKIVVSRIKGESLIKEKYDEYFDIAKVALPNVKVGSIVEISYVIWSDFLTNFQDWEFQNRIPAQQVQGISHRKHQREYNHISAGHG